MKEDYLKRLIIYFHKIILLIMIAAKLVFEEPFIVVMGLLLASYQWFTEFIFKHLHKWTKVFDDLKC